MSYEQLYLRNFNAMNDARRVDADKLLKYLWENKGNNQLNELNNLAELLEIDIADANTALLYLYARGFVKSFCKPMGNGDVIVITDEGYVFMNDTNLMEEKYNIKSYPISNTYNIGGNATNVGNTNNGSNTTHNETIKDETPWYKDVPKQLVIGIILIILTIFITWYFKVRHGIG